MKRIIYIIPILATCIIIGLIFSQCKKDTDCKVRIICKHALSDDTTDLLAGLPIPGCEVIFGKPDYADFATDTGICNLKGVYETSFQYESILELNANHYIEDTVTFETIHYFVKDEVKLIPGETVEKIIYLKPL